MNQLVIKLVENYQLHANLETAISMANYMKNNASFLGIKKPLRSDLEKPFLIQWSKLTISEIMVIVKQLVDLQYREYLYTAQQLLIKTYRKLSYAEIEQILEFALINSWWDNLDGWVMVIRRWTALDLSRSSWLVDKYAQSNNLWLRRMSIICQINHKYNEYDATVLFRAIELNVDDTNFFIQKAIGWALRDYSRFSALAVLDFIQLNRDKLSNLAIKEATRKITLSEYQN